MRKILAVVGLFAAGCGEGSPSTPPQPPPAPVVKPVPLAAPAGAAGSFAEHLDQLWDAKPAEGKAHVRLLVTSEGKPVAGSPDGIKAVAQLKLAGGGAMHMTGLCPNAKGRFVTQGLPPGTYTLEIESAEGAYKPWKKENLVLAAGDAPLLEVSLEK